MLRQDREFMQALRGLCSTYLPVTSDKFNGGAPYTPPKPFVRTPEQQAKLEQEMKDCHGYCCKTKEQRRELGYE